MLIVAMAPVCTLAASEALCHLGPRDAAFNGTATATSRPPGAWACHGLAWLGVGASTSLVEAEAEAEDSHDARIGLSRLKAALASETDGKHGKQGLVVPGQRCRAGCGQAWCRAGGGGWAE